MPAMGARLMSSNACQSFVVLFPSLSSAEIDTPHWKPAGKVIGPPSYVLAGALGWLCEQADTPDASEHVARSARYFRNIRATWSKTRASGALAHTPVHRCAENPADSGEFSGARPMSRQAVDRSASVIR